MLGVSGSCTWTISGPNDRIAERISEALDVPMLVNGQRIAVTASVGSASTCDPLQAPAEMLVRADQSMYRVKRNRGERRSRRGTA